MRLSDSGLKGVLPSKACSTMPSSRSPRDMSWYSARALRTLRRRFSIRTPVWTRSTRNCGSVAMVTNVPWYTDTRQVPRRLGANYRAARRMSRRASLLHRRQVLREPLQALRPPHFHPRDILRGLAGSLHDLRPHCECRPAGILSQGHSGEHFKHRLAFAVERGAYKDNPLRFDDLPILAGHRINRTVGCAHVDADGASRPRVQLADGVRESMRTPPLLHVFGIGPSLEDERTRRIKCARHDEFPLLHRGVGDGAIFSFGHAFSPQSSFCSDRCLNDRNFLSRTGDIAQPNRRLHAVAA